MQVPVALVQAPLQPANAEFMEGIAVSVTMVPPAKFAMQVVGQLIPAGMLVTVPLPVPVSATVRGKLVKVAVTA